MLPQRASSVLSAQKVHSSAVEMLHSALLQLGVADGSRHWDHATLGAREPVNELGADLEPGAKALKVLETLLALENCLLQWLPRASGDRPDSPAMDAIRTAVAPRERG